MLDEIGRGVDNPRHQNLVGGDFAAPLVEHLPFVGVARVGGFEKHIARFRVHQHGKHFVHINIATVRPFVIAPADVHPHLILRDIRQRMIQRIDVHLCDFDEFIIRELGEQHMPRQGEIRTIQLQI